MRSCREQGRSNRWKSANGNTACCRSRSSPYLEWLDLGRRNTVKKEKIFLPDGRYLLFFSFADEAEAMRAEHAERGVDDDQASAPAVKSEANAEQKRVSDEPIAMGPDTAGVGGVRAATPGSHIPPTT